MEEKVSKSKTKKKTTKKQVAKKATKKSLNSKASKSKVSVQKKEVPSSAKKFWAVTFSVVLVVLAVLAYKTITKEPISENVLAVVNGKEITSDEIDLQYNQLPDTIKSQVTKDQVLEQTIDKILVLDYAASNGITVTDQEVDDRIQELASSFGITTEQLEELITNNGISIDTYREAVREEIILTKFIDEILFPSIEVGDDEVIAYYEEHKQEFVAPEGSVRIRHILLETEEDAWKVIERADNGEDFASLAKELSIGPSAEQGGDLGFVNQESPLVEPFKEVALQLSEGEVSDPVQTEFGWHVIKREADVIPLDEAKEQIIVKIRQEQASATFQKLIADLRENASITKY